MAAEGTPTTAEDISFLSDYAKAGMGICIGYWG